MQPTRRDVLKIGGFTVLGAAAVTAAPWGGALQASTPSRLAAGRMPTPFRAAFTRPPALAPWKTTRDDDGVLVDHFSVTERPSRARIIPGLVTPVWSYNGSVPGPTIHVRQGRRAVMRVRNHLPARHPLLGHESTTSLHLHGSASLPQYDGYADDITRPGQYKDYRFPNHQPGRTLWYHDHGVHHTAPNVYSGLFAQYHLHDEAEQALLPQGAFDVPLVVGDAMFAADGSLAYDDNSHSGLWGDVILVNGRPWPVMKVQRRVYRFRILNAAITRSFRFQLGHGDPVTMVCTDGGLMPQSREVTTWRHGNAERYEILVDFRRYRPGQQVVLRNLSNPNNIDHEHTDKVMAFQVTDDRVDRSDPTWNRMPRTLASSHVMDLRPAHATRTRRLRFQHSSGRWTINGRTWQEVIDSDYRELVATPGLHDTEIWEITNASGGWFHPVHIHLIDFQILDRNGRPPFDYERGAKDVAYVGENETVRVLIQFGPHRGRYMVHCHNLVHEDHDMMTQFAVGWRPGSPDPNHPVLAAPAAVDNLPRVDRARPGRPARPSVGAGRRRVTLEWDEPELGGRDIRGYRIRGYNSGRRLVDVTVGDRRRHTVDGLDPGTTYRFTVTALGPAGTGRESARSAPARPVRRRPRVVDRTPGPGATGVAVGAAVTARLSEPVRGVSARSVRLRRVGGRRVPAKVEYDRRTGRITIRPRRRLAPRARYRVHLTRRIRDDGGNSLGPVAWRFTTGSRR